MKSNEDVQHDRSRNKPMIPGALFAQATEQFMLCSAAADLIHRLASSLFQSVSTCAPHRIRAIPEEWKNHVVRGPRRRSAECDVLQYLPRSRRICLDPQAKTPNEEGLMALCGSECSLKVLGLSFSY